MADATLVTGLLTLGGTLGGAALVLAGNATIERFKRTASRRDAAADRQAAVLREVQDVLGDYSRVWGGLIQAIDRREADLSTLPLTSDASILSVRFRTLMENVTKDELRVDLARYGMEVLDRAEGNAGALPLPELWDRMNKVQSHIGRVLRQLSP